MEEVKVEDLLFMLNDYDDRDLKKIKMAYDYVNRLHEGQVRQNGNRNVFNKDVAKLVDGVTKISKLNFSTKNDQNMANARKILGLKILMQLKIYKKQLVIGGSQPVYFIL